jgi:hypothetical protein
MQNSVTYESTWFSPETIREALSVMESLVKLKYNRDSEEPKTEKIVDAHRLAQFLDSRTVFTEDGRWSYQVAEKVTYISAFFPGLM